MIRGQEINYGLFKRYRTSCNTMNAGFWWCLYAWWEEGNFLCRPWQYDDGSRDDVPMLFEVTADGSKV